MDYNPFVVDLHAAEDAVSELEERRAALVEQISWASSFKPGVESENLAGLRDDFDEQNSELAQLEEHLLDLGTTTRELDSKTPGLERDARVDFRIIVRWLNDEHDRAKDLLKKHRHEVATVRAEVKDAEAKRDEATSAVADLAKTIQATNEALVSFAAFNRTDADNEIARIDDELSDHRVRRDYLTKDPPTSKRPSLTL